MGLSDTVETPLFLLLRCLFLQRIDRLMLPGSCLLVWANVVELTLPDKLRCSVAKLDQHLF